MNIPSCLIKSARGIKTDALAITMQNYILLVQTTIASILNQHALFTLATNCYSGAAAA
jgi:hypothetical protein